MRTLRATIALGLLLAAVPVGASAQAPTNDHYLNSLQLNAPGSKLERVDTLRDARNTGAATTQGDVFAPPRSGGPPEPTTCGPTSYGKTVWYDFYPDVAGVVRLRATGFNTALAVVPFEPATSVPDFARRQCLNASASTSEEFLVRVARRRAYTVQIGGVNGAGGNLEFLFDFLADTDNDGVLDDVDKCDRLKGPSSEAGCPVRLNATVTLRATPTAGGIKIAGLRVKAPRRSRVSVSCAGCRVRAKRARTVSFGSLRGKSLRAGTSLVVRVTRRNSIGTYVKYRISRGNFKKIERCLNPGSKKPRRRCG